MKTTAVLYLLQYSEPERAEGGPLVVRHFDTLEDAQKAFDRVMRNSEQHSPSIVKVTTTQIREAIAYAGS